MNVAYGESSRKKLDIYGDDLKPDSPLFVFVHGGYWQEMDKWDSAYVVSPLVTKGIRVIVIDYDLCPSVTLEQLVVQVHRSFQWISEYIAKHSIKSVSFAGHSAGAHLLACVLTKSFMAKVAADVEMFAYFISGVFDLEELRHLKVANENNILSLSDDNVGQLSPQFHDFLHLKDREVKIYVFVGEFESEKFKQQSRNFANGPVNELPSVTHKVVSNLDHFNIVEKLSEVDYELTKLITYNSTRS